MERISRMDTTKLKDTAQRALALCDGIETIYSGGPLYSASRDVRMRLTGLLATIAGVEAASWEEHKAGQRASALTVLTPAEAKVFAQLGLGTDFVGVRSGEEARERYEARKARQAAAK